MDSLVCDLTNALNSNSSNILIRKKTFRQTSRKKLINRRKSFRRSDCAIVKTALNTHGSFSSKSNLKPAAESGSTYVGGKSCLSRVKISSSSNFKHSTNGSNFNLPSAPATSKALMDANSRVRRHNSLNSFSKSSSSSNLAGKSRSKLNKHRRIMSLLLAARASITKIQSTDTNDLSNLVRFNATTLNKLNGDVYLTKPSCKQSKVKKLYKIQKTYRFHANYRLHCIRLRRLQRRHHHHHHRHHHQHRHHHHHHQGSHHHRNNTLTASSSSAIINENVSNMSSSTISTTTSNNSSSSSDLETSTSLAECYSMANLNINSDENCPTKLNLCSKTTKPKIKKLNKKSNRRRNMSLLSYKHHRQHKQSNTNVKLASSSKKQLVEEVQSKLATEQKTDSKLSNSSTANLVDLKRGSFKRKRMNAHYSRVKRIYLRENESSDQALNEHEDENDDDDDDDDYDDFSDSICSNLDESNEDKEAESNDEDKFKNKFKRIERYKKSNLAGVTMPIGSTCQMESDREENRRVEEFAGRRLHEEEDEIVNEQASIILKSEAEKTEADDEQSHSDWTPNECSFSNQQAVKPAINTVIPWWNEKNSLTQQEISLKSKSSSSYSNLSSSKNPKLNCKSTKDIDDDNLEDELDNDEDVDDEHEDDDEDEDEDEHEEEDDDDGDNRELDDSDQYNYEDESQEQTEFKNIISGALSLMTKSSKLAYRKKLNVSIDN